MFRRLVPAIVLLAALAPPVARAQVNIDQDKTPAHIYASDCAVCHKSIRGLANGRGSSSLTGYLSEHYTSSESEAAALAAYVLASGGGVGTPIQPQGSKPQPDHTRAATEGPKAREARKPTKPEEEPSASLQPRQPASERGKPEKPERSAVVEPGRPGSERKPPVERHELGSVTRTHGRTKPPEVAPPAAVAEAPKPAASPQPDANPVAFGSTAATPVQAQPDAAAPAPTDNIPD